MKKGEYPYEGYTIYKIFHKKEKRYYAVLVSASSRTTIAYAKYVLETHLRRKLLPGHHAHHKDGDKTNDDIYNLEEKEAAIHRYDHIKKRRKRCVITRCPACKKKFLIEYRQTHWGKKIGNNTRCSKKCGRYFANSVQRIEMELMLTAEEIKMYKIQ